MNEKVIIANKLRRLVSRINSESALSPVARKPSMRNTLKEYISLRGHIGHKSLMVVDKKQIHPWSRSFLLGRKNQHVIVNPTAFFDLFACSLQLIAGRRSYAEWRSLLIVNTNPEYNLLIENFSQNVQTKSSKRSKQLLTPNPLTVYYCNEKWVGGFLTNWKQVSKSIHTYIKWESCLSHYLSLNPSHNINLRALPRYKKMTSWFKGLYNPKGPNTRDLKQLPVMNKEKEKENTGSLSWDRSLKIERPDVIFLVNPNDNRHTVEEALSLNIPVIAITDSNTNLAGIPYPIPGNSNSIFFVHYCLQWIVRIMSK